MKCFFLGSNVLASRDDSCQSDPQRFPSQFQEQLNQGYENDEFPSGKDSWHEKRCRVYNPS